MHYWQRCQLLRMEGKERSIYEKASNETAETAFRAANPHGLSCSVLAAAIQGFRYEDLHDFVREEVLQL